MKKAHPCSMSEYIERTRAAVLSRPVRSKIDERWRIGMLAHLNRLEYGTEVKRERIRPFA